MSGENLILVSLLGIYSIVGCGQPLMLLYGTFLISVAIIKPLISACKFGGVCFKSYLRDIDFEKISISFFSWVLGD